MNSVAGVGPPDARLPRGAQALAAALPDRPRWLETRALLLSGDASVRVSDDGDAAVVLDTSLPSGALIGRADPVLLRDALADVPEDFELLVQMDTLHPAQAVLATWRTARAVVHTLVRPHPSGQPSEPGVVVFAPPQPRWLQGLPEDVRLYAGSAEAIAVRVVDGAAVAVCAAGDVSETLWDVGIDTLEGHRRQGYAAACFRALATAMAGQGKQPVWSAYENYRPSLTLAAKLGFEPVDGIAVLSPGRASTSGASRPSPLQS